MAVVNVHMPYLYEDNGGVKLVASVEKARISITQQLEETTIFFREPWLSDPQFHVARGAAREHLKPIEVPQYRAQHLDLMTLEPVGGSVLDLPEKSSECSPLFLDGQFQSIVTLGRRRYWQVGGAETPIPGWATTPIGFTSAILSAWVHHDKVGINGEFAINIPLDEATVYRIAPIHNQPMKILVTITRFHRPHTYLMDLVSNTYSEILVEGDPIYKSTILGNLCVFAQSSGVSRSISKSTNFEIVPLGELDRIDTQLGVKPAPVKQL